VALAPSVPLAVVLLLARHLLSQMDVPTRQTFLMLAVQDHEREGAASRRTSGRDGIVATGRGPAGRTGSACMSA